MNYTDFPRSVTNLFLSPVLTMILVIASTSEYTELQTPLLSFAWVMKRFAATVVMIGGLLLGMIPPPTHADSPTLLDQEVERLLASLTSEERVGQLMLVTFEGSYLGPDSPITQLIAEYNIGGVVLLADNDNISGQVSTPRLVQSLTTDLQTLAYESALATQDRDQPRAFVPLFIATSHSGNGQPGTQIAVGTTPLPSYMALGATWNPEFARQVGQIAGSELAAMGVNMLLGPRLDILQQPQTDRSFDLGVDSFGGHPYWVGDMAQAYITGVHEGSQSRVAVIAQNFPGLGFADTDPDQEIPLVPRALTELRQIDLMPYYMVTGGAGTTLARADGMQCANMRYQGENVRTITRPVCLDEQAANSILNLDYFRGWRQRGVMVSSSLGSRAVRRYYNISPFPHRQAAREAFLAGNDILYLDDFGAHSGQDQLSNVVDVIRFFAERYENDPVFRARVDLSVTRILRLKLTLYNGDLSLETILTSPTAIENVGIASAQLYNIAQRSATLIAPRRENLLPPPARNENIVIFTDSRLMQQCSYCAAYPQVSVNSLEAAIERMYGPFAGAQIRPEQVISFSFAQLDAYLHGDMEGLSDSQFRTNQRIGEALRGAHWIIFVTLGYSPNFASSNVLHEFLDADPGQNDGSRLVVIAMGSPTYLSSTEIGKLAAYYALYSHIPAYVDAAARALFQEANLTGALPISLPAIGYDIFVATAPAPDQTLSLSFESLSGRTLSAATSAADSLTINVGDRLTVRTEPILDRNGNRVPDNTSVEFTITLLTDNLQTRQYGLTTDGIARLSFAPTQTGRAQITARTGETTRSDTLQIMIAAPTAATTSGSDSLTPASEATSTLEGTTSSEVAALLGNTPVPSSADTANAPLNTANESQPLEMLDFVVALFGLTLMSALGFAVGLSSTFYVNGGIRVVLGCMIAGLIGYIYYGVNGPGTDHLRALLDDNVAPMILTLGAGLIGLLYTWWTLPRHAP